MTAAALTAFAALAVTGGLSPVLPLLAVGLLATYGFTARIEPQDWWVHWVLRLALYAAIGFLNANKSNEALVDALGQAAVMDTLGQWMAAELVIQAWRRQPAGGPQAASAILLSGLTLIAACQTSDEQYPRLFVPLYIFFLLLSLTRPERGAAALRWAALAAALGAGVGTYGAVWTNRASLTAWGTQYLEGRPAPETTGLSSDPTLGDTFGLRGSPRRVLRITGLNGITYLRGVPYDTYSRGHWGPDVDTRRYRRSLLEADAAGPRALVTPLSSTDGLLVVPLDGVGVDVEDNADALWAREAGGPLRVRTPQPGPYEIIQSAGEEHQGLFAVPLSPEERARCLTVPDEIAPGVRVLAAQIAGRRPAPRRAIWAVEKYLITHHPYSLTIHPGSGDPVSNFLLHKPPLGAHCEYFAASATILLRCLGVPTRYVVGYYAHEGDGPGVTVVRQRDAHAWAEAWVAGTGWVTVDATPGNGRPDGDINSIPVWQRLAEWAADEAVALRAWLLGLDWPRVSLGLGAMAVLALLARAVWRRLRRTPEADKRPSGYTLPGGDLPALAARFEALLARQGTPCPPGCPWQEHLARIGPPPPDWEGTFVRAYNSVRFGQAGDAARLPELLAEAERHFATKKGAG